MKKLVLIMVSALVLTIFISFNYLLWFRGQQITDYQNNVNSLKKQLEDKETYANSNVNYYLSQITQKDKEIDSLNRENTSLKENKNKLEQEKQQGIFDSNSKSAIIDKLKLLSDLEPLKSVIINWTDYIDKGKYEGAYKLQYNAPMSQDTAKGLSEFTNTYKNSIKSIKVKSINLVTSGIPQDRKGNLIFKAVFDVTKIENGEPGEFVQGLNEMYFTLVVDDLTNDWSISNISTYLN